MKTGLTFEPLVPGIVPLLEEWEAARHSGYSIADWESLESGKRVMAVAFYRISRLVKLHEEDAVTTNLEKRTKK